MNFFFSLLVKLKSFFFYHSNCKCIFIFFKYIRLLFGLDGCVLAKLSIFYPLDLLGHISDRESSTSLDTSHFKYIGIHHLLSFSGTPTWFMLLPNFVHGCTPTTFGKWFHFQSPGHSFLRLLQHWDISSGGEVTERRVVSHSMLR